MNDEKTNTLTEPNLLTVKHLTTDRCEIQKSDY